MLDGPTIVDSDLLNFKTLTLFWALGQFQNPRFENHFFFEFSKFLGARPKKRGPQSKFRHQLIFGLGEDNTSRKIERPNSKTVEGERFFEKFLS